MNNKKFTKFFEFIGFIVLKSTINSINALCCLLFALLVCIPSLLEAKVTGVCSDCHTMHNSQNGTIVVSEGPQSCLLNRAGCLGCHGQNPSGSSNIIPLGNIPQVLHAATTDLAGGNFKYLDTDDNKGHNVIDTGNQEGNASMFPPPGDQHTTGITATNFTCSGAKGCHGDRTVEDKLLAIKGAHHTDDGVLKFGTIDLTSQAPSSGTVGEKIGRSYRFLKGVKGGEVSGWEATISSTYHNEYFGDTTMGTSSLTSPANNTISGLCAECHGYFHGTTSSECSSASPWLRHPTDTSLPSSGEYTAYTAYSTVAPVARTSAWAGWTTGGGAPSGTVTPTGTTDDIVMCLSCHRAHASPYFKIMRWDYKSSTLSTAISGCNVCHTSKN
jgi:hypothetical protein